MPEPSSVQLIYDPDEDALDIANHSVIASADFESSAGGQVGSATIEIRDPDFDVASFTTGKRLNLYIDDQPLWSGYVLVVGKSNFLPAGDGQPSEFTKSRKWILRAVDNNILFDKRILHNSGDHLNAIPDITTNTMDGALLRQALADYADFPAGFDISNFIDDIFTVPLPPATAWAWPEQGTKLRELFESLAAFSGAVFYVGPDDAVHYHSLQDVENAWGFSDNPNYAPISGGGGFEGSYWGFREINADEDGSQLVPEAFVWGGSPFAGSGSTVLGYAYDSALADEHGRWQMAETHFGEKNFKVQETTQIRANQIVYGNPSGTPGGAVPGSAPGEGPRGLRFTQPSFTFAWHTKDVPEIAGVHQHLYPGSIVPIQLWTFSEDAGATPYAKFLPLRKVNITFPTGAQDGRAHVRFFGGFDLRNDDPYTLWRYLRQREAQQVATTVIPTSGTGSTTAQYGSFYQGIPTPDPDGAEDTFTIEISSGPIGYIPGTTQVFVNGLHVIPGVDYTESDSDAGEITFTSPPDGADELYVICRTLTA